MTMKIFNSVTFKLSWKIKCRGECTDVFISSKFILNLRRFCNNFFFNDYSLFFKIVIAIWMIFMFSTLFSFSTIWFISWVWRFWIIFFFLAYFYYCLWLRIIMYFKLSLSLFSYILSLRNFYYCSILSRRWFCWIGFNLNKCSIDFFTREQQCHMDCSQFNIFDIHLSLQSKILL